MAPRVCERRGPDTGGSSSHVGDNVPRCTAMSVRQRGSTFEVRWRVGKRKRSRTFYAREDAEAFDAKVRRQRAIKSSAFELQLIDRSDLGEQVYVVRGGELVKIGLSASPLERLAAL